MDAPACLPACLPNDDDDHHAPMKKRTTGRCMMPVWMRQKIRRPGTRASMWCADSTAASGMVPCGNCNKGVMGVAKVGGPPID